MKIEQEITAKISNFINFYSSYSKNIQKVFLYFSYEEYVLFSDFFFKAENKILKKNEIDKLHKIELSKSLENQTLYLDRLKKDFNKLIKLINDRNEKIPTEIKVVYDCDTKLIDTRFSYKNKYSDNDKFVTDIFNNWVSKEKNKK